MAEPGENTNEEEVKNEAPEADIIVTDPPVAEVSTIKDEDFLSLAKERYGKEFGSVDEIFADKAPVEKIVNPYEDILDEEDKQYLNFKKETGRGRKDFEALNTDYNAIDPLQLSRERIRKESGMDLSNEDADRYLAKELNIDLDDLNEIDPLDKIKLNAYAKPVRDAYIADKEKYKQPIAPKMPVAADEIVRLDNGAAMKKADYDNMLVEHQKHVEQVIASADSVTEANFKVVIDDNGTPKELSYKYDYSVEDKQSMVSNAKDPSATAERLLRSEKGFDTAGLNENMFWFDKTLREKAIASIVHKVRSEAIEEVTKLENNVNFQANPLPGQEPKDGVKIVPISEIFKR